MLCLILSNPFFLDLWSSFCHTSASTEKYCQVPLDNWQHEAIQQTLQATNWSCNENHRFLYVYVGNEQRHWHRWGMYTSYFLWLELTPRKLNYFMILHQLNCLNCQGHPKTVFWKTTVRKSKYYLEISINSKRKAKKFPDNRFIYL